MTVLLIIPPSCVPTQYHLAVPLLAGQLKFYGIDVTCIDANVEFYNDILTSKNIKIKTKELYNKFIDLKNKYSEINNENELLTNEKIKEYRNFKHFSKFFKTENSTKFVINCHKNLNFAIKTYKSKKDFFDIKKLNNAFHLLSIYSLLLSQGYENYKFNFNGTDTFDEKLLDLEYLDSQIDSQFIFDNYYQKLIKQISHKKIIMIGISISYTNQVIPALKLAYLLKKENITNIVLGGNILSRVIDKIANKKILFDKYCDFFIKNNGEKSIVELYEYLSNKREIEAVSNLLYKKDGEILENKYTTNVKANEVHSCYLQGIKLKNYFSPHIVAPLQLSKGCYWNKCTFCTHTTEKNYSIKNTEQIINEVKALYKIGIRRFEIIDDSVSPSIIEKFSKAILENNLKIHYMITARLENNFTKELLSLAYKSGLRMILWGFETGNKRIHQLINKGDIYERRINILENAYNNNIYSHLFIFYGFPTSKLNDEYETINFIDKNAEIIGNVASPVFFKLTMASEIANNPQKFDIKKIYENQRKEFDDSYSYEGSCLSENEKEIIKTKATAIIDSKFKYYLPLYIREHMLLYLEHYQKYDIKNFKKYFTIQ